MGMRREIIGVVTGSVVLLIYCPSEAALVDLRQLCMSSCSQSRETPPALATPVRVTPALATPFLATPSRATPALATPTSPTTPRHISPSFPVIIPFASPTKSSSSPPPHPSAYNSYPPVVAPSSPFCCISPPPSYAMPSTRISLYPGISSDPAAIVESAAARPVTTSGGATNRANGNSSAARYDLSAAFERVFSSGEVGETELRSHWLRSCGGGTNGGTSRGTSGGTRLRVRVLLSYDDTAAMRCFSDQRCRFVF